MFELDLISTGLKTLGTLLIVLALLFVVLFLFKRFSIQGRAAKGQLSIKVLSSLPLSAKDRIELIEIAGEQIVIGVSPGRINFISKINSLDGYEKNTAEKEPSGYE